MTFSGAVLLTDLNDFITPSQACIKPVQIERTSQGADSQIRLDDTGGYYEVSQDGGETKLETASISLNDCLACSGCITSAESVLVTLQSQKELYEVLKANQLAVQQGRTQDVRVVVVSVSPQSRASIAAKYDLSPLDVWKRLLWFYKTFLGAHHVFDTAFSRDFALIESAKEFVRRYREHHHAQTQPDSATTTGQETAARPVLPMLASACPGWICYAEKTHGYILPHIDSTKSPQQIMGSLVKNYLGAKLGVPANRVYHVAVMPCYDKKLEASRKDFYDDVYSTRDVDCVITTGEVEKMFSEQSLCINDMQALDVEMTFTKAFASPEENHGIPILAGSEGSSSGGYLSYILRYAAHVLFGVSLTPQDVENGTNGVHIRPGRNSDFVEYALCLPADPETPVLRFALAYGFRNIQNLVRKINPAPAAGAVARRRRQHRRANAAAAAATTTSAYDYVEIMACPSGCINGGGQLKPQTNDSGGGGTAAGAAPTTLLAASRDWIAKAEGAYRSVAVDGGIQPPEANQAVTALYTEWLEGEESEKARKMLHTEYHAVEKMDVNGLAVNW
ncbi:hypothetical protein HDU87_001731 [Geranomyces variabilis]|uniref:Iron hydrogenase small subunit domain-containing protein n=1 Tax=Geranomyces variabilis TaxID=109894 RepID=A0AAD5TAW7_9FUNG|nr:hypothetical protein HDU87_001731 [Geranomyces variabilis]